MAQCEKLNIPFLDHLPLSAEIDSTYHVVVDAIFGFSFKGSVRSPFDAVLSTLRKIKTPLASVDIPSGVYDPKYALGLIYVYDTIYCLL